MTIDQKRELMAKPVTLNGLPAIISGACGPFAVVRTLAPAPHHFLSGQWSWPAVARIVQAGGAFKF